MQKRKKDLVPDKAALTLNSCVVMWQVTYKQNGSLNFLNVSFQSQDCKVCPHCLHSYTNFPNTQEDVNERLKETSGTDIWFLLAWPTILIGYLCAAYWPWHCASLSVLGYSPVCPPCDNEMKTDAILEHMCASEFGKCFEILLSFTHKHILRWKLRCHFQDSQKCYIPAGRRADFQCSTFPNPVISWK